MFKRIVFAFIFLFALLLMSLDANERGFAQSVITAVPVTATPNSSGMSASSLLVLTFRDDGSTFTVPVRGQILLRIPRRPNTRLQFDPAILRLIGGEPGPLEPQPQPDEGDGSDLKATPRSSIYPHGGWLLLAIRPGTSPLTLETLPCTKSTLPDDA